ncbi:MAG TPA: retropepsin-like aspartic protease [Gammaproteobacteria bacterium]|nr:retropepsin-like aspartic protease [Gammaproteobacteria bacterium]
MAKRFSLLPLLLLSVFVPLNAFAGKPLVNVNLGFRLQDALLHGDEAFLKKESKTAPYLWQRQIAYLASLQVQMKLSETLKEARKCFKRGDSEHSAPLLIYCSIFGASAALTDLRVSYWAHIGVSVKSTLYPILKRSFSRDVGIGYFESFSFKDFLRAPLVNIRQRKPGFLPWRKDCASHGKVAETQIRIDGERICVLIDTGAGASMLTKATAKRLGLIAFTGNYGSARGLDDTSHATELGVAPRVGVGNVTITNFPFRVSGDAKYNILGSDGLKQLGNIRFTQTGLMILRSSQQRCTSPMAYAFREYFPMGPILPAVVNDKSVKLLFDSGHRGALATNERKFVRLNSKSLPNPITTHGAFGSELDAYITNVSFSLEPKSASSGLKIAYTPDFRFPVAVLAGFAILKKYSVELDFDSHKACFIPAVDD